MSELNFTKLCLSVVLVAQLYGMWLAYETALTRAKVDAIVLELAQAMTARMRR